MSEPIERKTSPDQKENAETIKEGHIAERYNVQMMMKYTKPI